MRIDKQPLPFLYFVAIFYVLWSARATFLYAIDEAFSSEITRAIYSASIKGVIWLGFAFIFAYGVRHLSPLKYLGLATFPSGKQWLACVGILLIYFGLVVMYETFAGGKSLSTKGLIAVLSITGFLIFIVSPFIEEVLFRGVFLQELLGMMPAGIANVVTSLLFVAIHLPFWLSHLEIDISLLINCVGVFIFSLVAGWLYIKSNSIWPSVVAHIANNILAASLLISR